MFEIPVCPECGVPEEIRASIFWRNSGGIYDGEEGDQRQRSLFMESDNLDPLFKHIEQIIGVSIEHIVIDAKRKWISDYMENLVPAEIRDQLQKRAIEAGPLIEMGLNTTRVCGCGNPTFLELRLQGDEDDFLAMKIEEPYSLPLYCGDVVGTGEALMGGEWGISCKQASAGVYEITVIRAETPLELRERLPVRLYTHREGDIGLDRCPSCGVPKALSTYKWDLDKGTINHSVSGKRMAVFGDSSLQAVFNELEVELGETIPQVVVEAQRRFTRTGFYSVDQLYDEGELRAQLALRGLGNLKEIKFDRSMLRFRLENTVNHLMTVGMIQGLFELAFGVESNVAWELSEEGDLEIEASP